MPFQSSGIMSTGYMTGVRKNHSCMTIPTIWPVSRKWTIATARQYDSALANTQSTTSTNGKSSHVQPTFWKQQQHEQHDAGLDQLLDRERDR